MKMRRPIGVRIGHYMRDYKKERDSTLLEFDDGTTFAAPRLLMAFPKKYQTGEGEPEITVPIRVIHNTEERGGKSDILHLGLKNQIRERVFYAALNRYLFENSIDEEVKVGFDMVEAFTTQDFKGYLRRYLTVRMMRTLVLVLLLVVLTPISILFLLPIPPSIFLSARLLRRVLKIKAAIEKNRAGEYLIREIAKKSLN